MIKTIKTTLASLLMLVMGLQMSAAQGLSANDMAFAFGGAEPGAVQEVQRYAPAPQMLSAEEMEATEGEWLYHAVRHGGGAILGGYGAGYGYLAGGGRDPWGFVGHVASGAGAGLFSPVSGFRSAGLTFGGSFTGGGISSFGSSRGWW